VCIVRRLSRLLRRGGWHSSRRSLVNCDHGDSMTESAPPGLSPRCAGAGRAGAAGGGGLQRPHDTPRAVRGWLGVSQRLAIATAGAQGGRCHHATVINSLGHGAARARVSACVAAQVGASTRWQAAAGEGEPVFVCDWVAVGATIAGTRWWTATTATQSLIHAAAGEGDGPSAAGRAGAGAGGGGAAAAAAAGVCARLRCDSVAPRAMPAGLCTQHNR
jgi:hypothetical protein